jgi:hypothetical protein
MRRKTMTVIHDSMGITGEPIKELRGVKLGQIVRDKKIKHITPAGEAIFEDGMWDYADAINGTNSDL